MCNKILLLILMILKMFLLITKLSCDAAVSRKIETLEDNNYYRQDKPPYSFDHSRPNLQSSVVLNGVYSTEVVAMYEPTNSEFLEQLDSAVATIIQEAMRPDSSILTESTSQSDIWHEQEPTIEIIHQESVEQPDELSVSLKDSPESHNSKLHTFSSFDLSHQESFKAPRRESESHSGFQKGEFTNLDSTTEFLFQDDARFEKLSTHETTEIVEQDTQSRYETTYKETVTPDSQEPTVTIEHGSEPQFMESVEETSVPFADAENQHRLVEKALKSAREQREALKKTYTIAKNISNFSRKELNLGSEGDSPIAGYERQNYKDGIENFEEKNSPVPETTTYKETTTTEQTTTSEEPETTTTKKPNFDPKEACKKEKISCLECKAISPNCHYNYTGKFCMYANTSHANAVYECGVRFIAADGYSPMMICIVGVVLVSVGVGAYYVMTLLQQKRRAALPPEEMDNMRDQVQFIRDRRTNKYKKIIAKISKLRVEPQESEKLIEFSNLSSE